MECHHLETVPKVVGKPFLHHRKEGDGRHLLMEDVSVPGPPCTLCHVTHSSAGPQVLVPPYPVHKDTEAWEVSKVTQLAVLAALGTETC